MGSAGNRVSYWKPNTKIALNKFAHLTSGERAIPSPPILLIFTPIINHPVSVSFSLFCVPQVQQLDRMSNRICHACISFLNSWQSFKNRCNAAQKKQQTYLDIFLAKERAKKTVDSIQLAAERQRQLQTQRALASAQQQRILKTALTQSLNSTPYNTSNNNSVDVVCNASSHLSIGPMK